MTSVLHLGPAGYSFARYVDIPDYNSTLAGNTTSIERLPAESIGSMTITLTNVVIGSSIQVETQTGTLIENRTAAATTEVFTVPAYGIGSPNNDLRIKVRKGSSAPYYRPFETIATAFVGSASIYVAQVPDQ